MSNARNLANLLNSDTAVTSADILDGTVATLDIADDAITTAKILDGAVTSAKIDSGAIDGLVTKSASAPSSPANGDVWYDTDDFKIQFWDGTAWQLIKSSFTLKVSL